jgi:hypothetical protein
VQPPSVEGKAGDVEEERPFPLMILCRKWYARWHRCP